MADGPAEPEWIPGKHGLTEPNRLLTAAVVKEQVRASFGRPRMAHVTIPQEVV